MAALSTPARTMAPRRLRSRNSQSSSAMPNPKPIRNSRYAENTPAPICTRALQHLRRRQAQHQPAPERLHQIEEDEGEPEGQQHLIHVAAADRAAA